MTCTIATSADHKSVLNQRISQDPDVPLVGSLLPSLGRGVGCGCGFCGGVCGKCEFNHVAHETYIHMHQSHGSSTRPLPRNPTTFAPCHQHAGCTETARFLAAQLVPRGAPQLVVCERSSWNSRCRVRKDLWLSLMSSSCNNIDKKCTLLITNCNPHRKEQRSFCSHDIFFVALV